MAVMMQMRWKGVSLEQYEAARKLVNWEGETPAGGMYHVAAHDGTALRVVDVWQSAEQFQAFVEGRLNPGTKQLGIEGEPEVEIYPAYAVFAPGYSAR